MYLEEIDLGEGQPRQIASGLFGFISLEDFTGSEVLVCTNLKRTLRRSSLFLELPACQCSSTSPCAAVDMRGHMSNGMVLAASDAVLFLFLLRCLRLRLVDAWRIDMPRARRLTPRLSWCARPRAARSASA